MSNYMTHVLDMQAKMKKYIKGWWVPLLCLIFFFISLVVPMFISSKSPSTVIVISSIAPPYIQNIPRSMPDLTNDLFVNISRIMGGASIGGLLAFYVSYTESRKRSRNAYIAIIDCLCDLSADIWTGIKYGNTADSSSDETLNALLVGGRNDRDLSEHIGKVRSLIYSKASTMGENDIFNFPFKPKMVYNLELMTGNLFRDAINDTKDEYLIKKLNGAKKQGSKLFGSLTRYGNIKRYEVSTDQLWQMRYFLEVCLPLYGVLLRNINQGIIPKNLLILLQRRTK